MGTLARITWTCIIVGLFIAGVVWFFARSSDNQSVRSGTASQTSPATTPAYHVDAAALGAVVESLLDQHNDLDCSVSVVDLQTNTTYHYGDTSSYTAASISKLLTATLYLHMVELGQATMAEPIGGDSASSQLEKLIVESDNAAWHAFNERLTTSSLQTYAQALGMRSYDAAANTVSSDDIAHLLNKLARGALLNNSNTDLLLSLMRRANMQNYIVAGIPKGATAYHKVGYLADRLHDAAIIKKGKRSYVLVIFSKSTGSYNFPEGAALFGRITAATSQVFFDTPGDE